MWCFFLLLLCVAGVIGQDDRGERPKLVANRVIPLSATVASESYEYLLTTLEFDQDVYINEPFLCPGQESDCTPADCVPCDWSGEAVCLFSFLLFPFYLLLCFALFCFVLVFFCFFFFFWFFLFFFWFFWFFVFVEFLCFWFWVVIIRGVVVHLNGLNFLLPILQTNGVIVLFPPIPS